MDKNAVSIIINEFIQFKMYEAIETTQSSFLMCLFQLVMKHSHYLCNLVLKREQGVMIVGVIPVTPLVSSSNLDAECCRLRTQHPLQKSKQLVSYIMNFG